MSPPLTLLVDNGSLEPAAPLALRELAARLAKAIDLPVEPISLLHSSGVPAAKLAGKAAEILEPALERRIAAGQDKFFILPLFFGPSGALTDYLPARLAHLQGKHAGFSAKVAAPLFGAGDDRLARILADHVRSAKMQTPRVALVDHGSPVAAVTDVRNELAKQLAARLGSKVLAVAPCSMERRPEPAYDFNEPLLAGLLDTAPWTESRVVVALQFLSPGRHAGKDGDVAKICSAAMAKHPKLKTQPTALVGVHPLLVEILADRWRAATLLA